MKYSQGYTMNNDNRKVKDTVDSEKYVAER